MKMTSCIASQTTKNYPSVGRWPEAWVFAKLEIGLCAMTKDDLADSLAYNSLKVQKL
jgi:hypothetical protein